MATSDRVLRRLIRTVSSTGAAAVLAAAATAFAQAPGQCERFGLDRAAGIKRGICYARSGGVVGDRGQIERACNRLLQQGAGGGHQRISENVCRGVADRFCNHGGFDVFGGPTIRNGACRAPQASCDTAPNPEERSFCNEVKQVWAEAIRPPPASAPSTLAQTPNRAGNCQRFPETRDGFILRGICEAKTGRIDTRSRDTVNRTCETAIFCLVGVFGDCAMARNVCKGVADPNCSHPFPPLGEFPTEGPGTRQGACKAVRGECTGTGMSGELDTCFAVRRLWTEGSRAP